MADKNVQLHNADGDNLLPKTTLQNITDLTIETITPTITKLSGNADIYQVFARRYGKVVHIQISVNTTAVTSAGSNVFEGQLSSHRPILNVVGSSFAGGTVQEWALGTDGKLTVRNLIGSLNGNGQKPTTGFTYIEA